MDLRAQTLISQGEFLFGRRVSLVSLWQELAMNFYVERADFTVTRTMGNDFADHLTTSFPMIARRDLANTFSAMLRPTNKEWFHIRTEDEDQEDSEARRWLEWAEKRMRTIMYSRDTNFVRATKEGDNDFATFGQAVLSIEKNATHDGILYRCWHLRDVAWCENYSGQIDTVHRKWKATVSELYEIFGSKKLSPKLADKLDKEPYAVIECRHIVIPASRYNGEGNKKWNTPFVSIYVDVTNQHVIEEVGQIDLGYVIPRWQTVSGSQYAYSPCTVAGLPDARLIQSMTLTLLEAGEKYTNPPMVAVQEALRSDVALYAGGITWVDAQYDERLGEVLRPLSTDKAGMPLGLEMQKDIREMISTAFFLNKITMPPIDSKQMTAYEMSVRQQEYVRTAMPLFEPMETDYNGALCEETFSMLMRLGAFGSPKDMPDSLSGQQIKFKFESPLSDSIGRDKGQRFMEAKQLLQQAAELDPSAALVIDARAAIRDIYTGIGTPATWVRSEKEVDAMAQAQQEEAEEQKLLNSMQQGADAADKMGSAGKQFAEAQNINGGEAAV